LETHWRFADDNRPCRRNVAVAGERLEVRGRTENANYDLRRRLIRLVHGYRPTRPTAYWLGGKNTAVETRANVILFIARSSLISLFAYLFSGLFVGETMSWVVFSGPAYGAGLFAGARLFGLASERTFRRAGFALIAASVVTSLPVWK
jgi:hypothetical protein